MDDSLKKFDASTFLYLTSIPLLVCLDHRLGRGVAKDLARHIVLEAQRIHKKDISDHNRRLLEIRKRHRTWLEYGD